MVLLLLGPPGSGKGTQSKVLQEKLSLVHLSTGDMLRAAVQSGSTIGKQVEAVMKRGDLVSDTLVLTLLKEKVELVINQNKGMLFDGYPRNLQQANALEGLLNSLHKKIDIAIAIDVDDVSLIKRLTGRRTCKQCGTGFHILFQPPRTEGQCDRCGGVLIQRNDDNEQVIKDRLYVYHEQTAPLLEYYQKNGILKKVDGQGTPQEITARILHLVPVQ